jgi:hypothetical protein
VVLSHPPHMESMNGARQSSIDPAARFTMRLTLRA